MNIVLTSVKKIEQTDPTINITKMNDTNVMILLWLCLPSSGILSKPVSDKRERLKAEYVTPVKIWACIEEMQMKIKDFGERIESLQKI